MFTILKIISFLFILHSGQAISAQTFSNLTKLLGSSDHNKLHNLKALGPLNPQTYLNITLVTGSLANSQLLAQYFSSLEQNLTLIEETNVHLKIRAMVSQFSQIFNTKFVEYECSTNKLCFATTSEVYMPHALHSCIIGILGLEQVISFKPNYKIMEKLNITSSRLPKNSYLLGSQAAQIYGAPMSTGKNVCIGIVTLGGYFMQSDLDDFFTYSNLGTAPPIKIAYVDGAKQDPSEDPSENYLDVEIISSVVPQAIITFYFAPKTTLGLYDGIAAALHYSDVVSLSWGSREDNNIQSIANSYQTLLASYNNIPIFVATGDFGAYDKFTKKISVGFPASCPNAIGN